MTKLAAPRNCKKAEILFLLSQMVTEPANSIHAGISAMKALSTARFILLYPTVNVTDARWA
jgi:hypothetical protein